MARAQAVPAAVLDIDEAIKARRARRAVITVMVPALWAEMDTLDAEVDQLLDLRRAESVRA